MWREGDGALDQFEEFEERLFHLRQETRSTHVFALEFRTLAAGTGWNNRALIDHYRCSLREDVHRELACRDTTLSFDQLVDLSIRLDNLLATRRRSDQGLVVPSSRTQSPIPTNRQGDRRGFPLVHYLLCLVGSSGNRGSRQGALASPQVSWHHPHPESSVAHMFMSVTFPEFFPHSQHKALVDSGAAGNFIDKALVHSFGDPHFSR